MKRRRVDLNLEEMDRVLDLIGSLDGIDRTVSFIVLSTRIDR
jgi:hypothetical protein